MVSSTYAGGTAGAMHGMNGYKVKRFELRLGTTQVAAVSGLVLGCMCGAFFFGYLSGKDVGFALALDGSSKSIPRIPIAVSRQQPEKKTLRFSDTSPIDSYKEEDKATSGSMVVGSLLGSANRSGAIVPIEKANIPVEDRLLADLAHVGEGAEESAGVVEKEPKEMASGSVALDESGSAEEISRVQKVSIEQPKVELPALKKEAPVKRKEAALPELPVAKDKAPVKVAEVEEVRSIAAKLPERGGEASTITSSKDVPAGWYAQVAAPEKLGDAQRLFSKLRDSGFPVVIEHARVRGTVYYRVLVGKEATRERANRMVDQLRRETYIATQPFVKYVK